MGYAFLSSSVGHLENTATALWLILMRVFFTAEFSATVFISQSYFPHPVLFLHFFLFSQFRTKNNRFRSGRQWQHKVNWQRPLPTVEFPVMLGQVPQFGTNTTFFTIMKNMFKIWFFVSFTPADKKLTSIATKSKQKYRKDTVMMPAICSAVICMRCSKMAVDVCCNIGQEHLWLKFYSSRTI